MSTSHERYPISKAQADAVVAAMSNFDRMQLAFAMSSFALKVVRAAIVNRHPDWDDLTIARDMHARFERDEFPTIWGTDLVQCGWRRGSENPMVDWVSAV